MKYSVIIEKVGAPGFKTKPCSDPSTKDVVQKRYTRIKANQSCSRFTSTTVIQLNADEVVNYAKLIHLAERRQKGHNVNGSRFPALWAELKFFFHAD